MATINYVLVPRTGILAAIERHCVAWAAYQVAPEGPETERTFLEMEESLEALVGTPCLRRSDAQALADYLRWYVNAERDTRDWTQVPESVALARAADLSLLLMGERPVTDAEPADLSLGFLVARVVRRVSQVGELLACIVLIGGGMVATGFASLIS